MKLNELFNDEYNLSVFQRKVNKLSESHDDAYLVKVRANVLKSLKQLERDLPTLKHQIDDGALELKPIYINIAALINWLKPLLDHLDSIDAGKNSTPSHVKDHPFWGNLPAFNQ